jgi:uncharacterized protein YfaS (alpha-2-macroglobulin family)
MRSQKLASLLIALFIISLLNAQNFNYTAKWKEIESLNKKGLYDQALKQTKSLLEEAQKEQNSVQTIKALIHQFNYSSAFEDDAVVKSIEQLESLQEKENGVEQALINAALSDLYLFYYQKNSWQINQRKDISGARPSDIAYWSKKHFKTKIERLLESSLNYEKLLKETSSVYWKEIFSKDSTGFEVFPTLYDFVAWKALGFYESYDFKNDAEEDLLVLNDPALFGDNSAYLKIDLSTFNKDLYKVKSLQLYQNLLQLHQGRKTPLPLLYADVKRLEYVENQGQIDGKQELIENSLLQLYEQNKTQYGLEFVAQKLVEKWVAGDEQEKQKAVNLCDEMIKSDREAEYFKYRKEELLKKVISIGINDIILPNQAVITQLSFTNIKDVWFRIYRLNDDLLKGKESNDEMFQLIKSQKLVSQFDIKVSDKERLIEKSALISVPPLDFGRYAIIFSNEKDFNQKKNFVALKFFWVSRFQLIESNDNGMFLLVDQQSGARIENAKVEVYSQQWEYTTRNYVEQLITNLETDKNGQFTISVSKARNISVIIRKGQDEWRSGRLYINHYEHQDKKTERHQFFTDRAIYRPGQTVYFKGIFYSGKKNDWKVIPDLSKEIKLYGANGKMLQSMELTSNEFGSVSGSFVLPMNGLNGNYRISSGKSSVNFKVEEYKRPKFELTIEKPDQEYKINEQVLVKGTADYYAGMAVQNAEVKYQVKRTVFNPWGRYYLWPVQDELAITAGKTTTDVQGKFEISFTAIAPEYDGLNPWYNYQITAEVSDETGETHTKNLDIVLGKSSMNISTNLPEIMDITDTKDVKVSAETPNGQKLHPEITFKLEKLKSPKKLKKAIGFDYDTLLISEDQISKDFADYDFTPQKTEVEAIVLEKKMDTKIDSIIPKSIFKSLSLGKYKMTLNSFDKDGNPVIDSAEFQVFSSQKEQLSEPKKFFSFINKSSLEVGDILQLSYGSSFKDAHFYYQFAVGYNQAKVSEWIEKPKELNHISIPITEEMRGGISLQIFMQKDQQFYGFSKVINVPFSNKDLDVKLTTFRNPMSPGEKEQWKLKIKNNEEAAEVLAGMYDASLNAFVSHSWDLWPYFRNFSNSFWSERRSRNFQRVLSNYKHTYFSFQYPQLLNFSWSSYNNYQYDVLYSKSAMPGGERANVMNNMDDLGLDEEIAPANIKGPVDRLTAEPEKKEIDVSITPRKNLQETAFFYPQMLTDKDGNIELNFTSPEALTRWKLMVLAHTKDMKIGQLTQEVITQKELMVMPNLPRFLRGEDQIAISTKILNLLEEVQPIKARLEILDAATKEPLSLLAAGQANEQSLSLQANGQAEVSWMIQVPEKVGAVIIRITAEGDQHSDGEEHILPVLSQLHFLTDTYPFALSNKDNISAEDLNLRLKDRNAEDELTLEIVSNPLWYVVQAIPDYQPPQKDNALQWMNYYYIQSMAFHIVKENPEIEAVFKQWQMNAPEELESELFQNPELKKVMIEETPWLLNAENQSQRKKAIARLFDENNLQNQLQTALQKLQEMQKPNGGFGWIDGMKTSPWISAQIASSLGQLLESGILDLEKDHKVKNIIRQLVKYLDEELEIAYQKATKDESKYYSNKAALLMARSCFLDFAPLKKSDQAFVFFLNKWKEKMHQKSISERMKLARVLWKSNQKEESLELIAAIQDIALTDESGGIYWRDFQQYESVSQQAEMIALFELTNQESKWIEGAKLWLLEQKRANDWGNSTATARACLSMINQAPQLSKSPKVYINLNGKEQLIGGNAGTGYFKQNFKGKEIEEVLRNLTIRQEGEGMIFGALYDQYFEKMSEIESHAGGVKINKKIFVVKINEEEQALLPIDEGAQINLGDRVLVRMTLSNEQSMDFVHLRDYLPAGFENQDPLSAYRWQGNVSYYQSPGDLATDYYIPHLPKGKFVIEYELNATISGKLNSGPAEIQSLYAPEFGGHSAGEMIEVVK